ncbi:hypothetical protein RND81_09G119200 [Saponaria officinalis]|uniref:Btz domain-containing protein n=1 Tax=Saponaria officinalis TaxID=3572 RepID=A0AAW1ILI7_SAPOF
MTKGEQEEDNSDYESDPELLKMSLNMRRREASDDEQEEEEIHGNLPNSRSGIINFDAESDGEGAADEYNDGEDDDEYYDEYVEEEEYGEVEEREIGGEKAEEKAENDIESVETVKGEGDGGIEGEEKKEVEPFSVPTSGAFYMHDDRFRDRNDGKHRRTFDGRKLWESRDERKWGHDKYEELNVQDRHRYEEGRRSSRGSYRSRGRARGASRGNGRGNRVREFSANVNQNASPKDVRGRGPRRYHPLMEKTGETHRPQYKQSARSFDRSSRTGSGRMAASTGSSNVEHEAAPAKKVGSNLSSASPPFYPSGASTKDVPLTQKKEMNTGNRNRNFRPSVDPNFSIPVSNSLVRGKNIVGSVGIEKLHINDSVSPASTKVNNDLHLRSHASSSSSRKQWTHLGGQGWDMEPTKPAVVRPPQTNNQVNKASLKTTQAYQRRAVQTQAQLQAPGQQLAQRPLIVSQSSSPPKTGNGAVQGTGRGSLVYGGKQVGSGGNVNANHGDPNVPAFFPVMQFGGQHPSGMGAPAVGMAFPGYVGQPDGLGNSEMTWLPMLASAASALGATFPPYLAVDGNFHPRPTGQISALHTPSKDDNLSTSNNEINPQQRSGEVGNNQFSLRQNKPRRYSEMNFSQ